MLQEHPLLRNLSWGFVANKEWKALAIVSQGMFEETERLLIRHDVNPFSSFQCQVMTVTSPRKFPGAQSQFPRGTSRNMYMRRRHTIM